MTRFAGSFSFGSLALAVVLCAVGCHSNQDQPSTDATAQNQADQGQDPAAANLATASYNTSGAPSASSSAPQPSSAPQSASPDNGSDYSESADDSTYAEPPVATAPQPPPALPDYQQPPCPGDGYIWTPGYWNYARMGYYWVPGVWTRAPYTGALWTPGFWAFAAGHYVRHPGYWGSHIGYYGGINYGHGYTGAGYEGGYWNNNHFSYNRAVTNVNTTVVHNVYNYTNITHVTNVTRVSYNGGSGGVQVRPRPVEIAARREPIAPRMATQMQHEESYRNTKEQFVTPERARPTNLAVNKPIEADHNVKPEVRPLPQPRPEPHPAPPPAHREQSKPPAPPSAHREESKPPAPHPPTEHK